MPCAAGRPCVPFRGEPLTEQIGLVGRRPVEHVRRLPVPPSRASDAPLASRDVHLPRTLSFEPVGRWVPFDQRGEKAMQVGVGRSLQGSGAATTDGQRRRGVPIPGRVEVRRGPAGDYASWSAGLPSRPTARVQAGRPPRLAGPTASVGRLGVKVGTESPCPSPSMPSRTVHSPGRGARWPEWVPSERGKAAASSSSGPKSRAEAG